MGEEGADRMDRAPQVYAHHPLPVLARDLPAVSRDIDAGVVHEDVDRAEGVERRRRQRVHRCLVTDVGRHAQHVLALVRNLSTATARRFSFGLASTTRMPAAAKERAIDRPMPVLAPVTTATRPSSCSRAFPFVSQDHRRKPLGVAACRTSPPPRQPGKLCPTRSGACCRRSPRYCPAFTRNVSCQMPERPDRPTRRQKPSARPRDGDRRCPWRTPRAARTTASTARSW